MTRVFDTFKQCVSKESRVKHLRNTVIRYEKGTHANSILNIYISFRIKAYVMSIERKLNHYNILNDAMNTPKEYFKFQRQKLCLVEKVL